MIYVWVEFKLFWHLIKFCWFLLLRFNLSHHCASLLGIEGNVEGGFDSLASDGIDYFQTRLLRKQVLKASLRSYFFWCRCCFQAFTYSPKHARRSISDDEMSAVLYSFGFDTVRDFNLFDVYVDGDNLTSNTVRYKVWPASTRKLLMATPTSQTATPN